MKLNLVSIVACGLLSSIAFSQTEVQQPSRLVALKEGYEKAVATELAPIKEVYAAELQKLKDTYSKAGDLDSALAVDAEINGEPAKKNIARILALKENYTRAADRATSGLKASYNKELAKLKVELTKAGDLQSALAVDAELKATGTATVQTALIKPSTLSGSPATALTTEAGKSNLAVVDVEKAQWGELKKGALCYTGSKSYEWSVIPSALEGVRCSKPSPHGEILSFKVIQSGLVFIATTTRFATGSNGWEKDALDQKGLQKKGWHHLSEFDKLRNTDSGSCMVFYKQCVAGETYSIRTEKYVPPMVLTR